MLRMDPGAQANRVGTAYYISYCIIALFVLTQAIIKSGGVVERRRVIFHAAVPEPVRIKFKIDDSKAFIDRVDHMPEDDDTNYTVTGYAVMKRHSRGFTPADVVGFWLNDIPIMHTCTAERIAYRNRVLAIEPPESARYRNPYREWIGAQIRADFFGYAAPGNPELAAEYAWRDASISHVKNGIYGEMFVAAMLAAAAVEKPKESGMEDSIERVIETGLSQIPAILITGVMSIKLLLKSVIISTLSEMPRGLISEAGERAVCFMSIVLQYSSVALPADYPILLGRKTGIEYPENSGQLSGYMTHTLLIFIDRS